MLPLTIMLPLLLTLTVPQHAPAGAAAAANAPAASARNDEEETFIIGGDVSAPEKVSGANPEYTDEALERQITGAVSLSLWIEKDGTTSHITVMQGLGHGLDEAAQKAVRRWIFKPAMRNGEPVTVRTAIRVRFVLEA